MTDQEIYIFILTPVNLLLEVHYSKYRMANPGLSLLPVKDYQMPQEIIPLENKNCVG